MKKYLFNILLIVLLLATVLLGSDNSIITKRNTYMSGSVDLKPRCSMSIPERMRTNRYAYATIICYDQSGFSDKTIGLSDITVNSGLFSKVKLISISEPKTIDGYTYSWEIQYKTRLIGNYSMSLNFGAVSDKSGKPSLGSIVVNGKVTLW